MKLLYVTQEMNPYTALSEISGIVEKLPQKAQEKQYEIRVLMPKFGNINERRHRLHEVVRLSGMNIIVDDEDYPLIIKVASIPGSRLQVYFLDNEEFFKKRNEFCDEEGTAYDDNVERMVFFNKGAVETVRKFGWAPDIIHCHGSFTALVPVYVKKAYGNDPIFNYAKIIYSGYTDLVSKTLTDRFWEVAKIGDMEDEHLDVYKTEDGIDLNKGALHYSDGLIIGSESFKNVPERDIPTLNIIDNTNHLAETVAFYHQFIEQEIDNE
jgi:starch synthase